MARPWIRDEAEEEEEMTTKLKLIRTERNDKQTLGELWYYDGSGNMFNYTLKKFNGIPICHTLELPWFNNQKFVSCIPLGMYRVTKWDSPKHGKCFKVWQNTNRTNILIHSGNYYYQIYGCILVGSELRDINNDGYMDVIDSKKTLKTMLLNLPNEWELEIMNKEDSKC